MITQQNETNTREVSVQERHTAKRAFVEPEISSPVDVLEATAFFQTVVGGTDPGSDLS